MNLDAALVAVRRMEEIGTYPYFIEVADAELVRAVTALAIPRYWNEELGLKILQEFLGLTSQEAKTRLWEVRRLFFVYTRERDDYKYSEEARQFFRSRAKAEFENLETFKMLAEYYRVKLGQSKDEYKYRNITLRLAGAELQYNVEQGLNTIAEFVGRALLGRRIADLRAACAVLEDNIDTLGEWRKHCLETLKGLYEWARKEWGVQ